MAIVLNPSDGLRNVSTYPSKPGPGAAAREQFMNVIDQIVSQANTELDGKASTSYEVPISPTLINGWTNDTETWSAAGYYKDSLNIVHIQGRVINGTIGQNAFILDENHRPGKKQIFDFGSRIIIIDIDGSVLIFSGTSPINLNGITFRGGL